MTDERDSITTDDPGATKRRAVVFTERDPVEAVRELPRQVFPITIRVELPHRQSRDTELQEGVPGESDLIVRRPGETPYVPRQVVYFDNPAERPPVGEPTYRKREAVEDFATLIDHLTETYPPLERADFSIESAAFVEVSPNYLTTEDGTLAVTPELYSDNASMTLTYFESGESLVATDIRDQMESGLPGERRTPLRLTRVKEVTAKEARTGRGTRGAASRRRYYTAAEAEKADRYGATPAVYAGEDVSRDGRGTRPLQQVVSNPSAFVPALADCQLVELTTFRGESEEKELFYAEDIIG